MSGHDVHARSADTRLHRSDCASRVDEHDTHRKLLLVSARVYSSVVVVHVRSTPNRTPYSTRTIAKASIFCAPYTKTWAPFLVPAL